MNTLSQMELSDESIDGAELIQVDHALESFRDAGYDLPAASGEVIDNSFEGKARHVNIQTFEIEVEDGRRHKKSIDEIAFADDGVGIPLEILPSSLTMGFSTRYNKRDGLGRYGVGAKLAALSQARRVDIYTRTQDSPRIYHAYFDLDLIKSGEQKFLRAEEIGWFPEKYAHLMQDVGGKEFKSGTLVVWSKVDRLEEGGKFGTSVNEHISELFKYLGRTYRKFLSNEFSIVLNGKQVMLHDPLFLLDNPRVANLLRDVSPEERCGELIETGDLDIDGYKVTITVTLLPKVVRLERGRGGKGGKGAPLKELYIAENQGRISILRNGREIYYNVIPYMYPTRVDEPDRFIGIEVSFPAALDEYFQVRHVKRGAEPVNKLRDEMRHFLRRPITVARKKIQDVWAETANKERRESPQHQKAKEAYGKMEETTPRGIGGTALDPMQQERILEDAVKDMGMDDSTFTPDAIEETKERIRNEPITVIDVDWPGRELFTIDHLNGRPILKINRRHPLMRDVYLPIQELADGKLTNLDEEELRVLARKIEGALDLLFFSYAKAESMHPDPDEQYSSLRTYWGHFAAEGVQQLLRMF